MKVVYIFALLALCVWGWDYFYPKSLGCSFHVHYRYEEDYDNTTGFYSGYGDSRSFTQQSSSASTKITILRADINGGTEGQALYISGSQGTGTCLSVSYVDNSTNIGLHGMIEEPFLYTQASSGKWNNEDCTVYTDDDDRKLYVKDERVIGYESQWMKFFAFYSDAAYEADFSVHEQYKNCPQEVFQPIQRIDGCTLLENQPYFVPDPLPCTYTVEYKATHSEEPYNTHGYEAGYGGYLAFTRDYKIHGANVKGRKIQRIDIHSGDKETSAIIFDIFKAPGYTPCRTDYNNPYDKNLNYVSDIHYYLVNEIDYKSKKEGVDYNGEKCDELNDYEGRTYYTKDGHVVGVVTWDGFEDVSYTFTSYSDTAYEGDFMVPKSFEDECSEYSKGYEVPEKVDNCTILGGNRPGSSSASTIKAFVFLVMATIMSTLLF